MIKDEDQKEQKLSPTNHVVVNHPQLREQVVFQGAQDMSTGTRTSESRNMTTKVTIENDVSTTGTAHTIPSSSS